MTLYRCLTLLLLLLIPLPVVNAQPTAPVATSMEPAKAIDPQTVRHQALDQEKETIERSRQELQTQLANLPRQLESLSPEQIDAALVEQAGVDVKSALLHQETTATEFSNAERRIQELRKTIAELERIGDVADKICRTALEKFSQQHQPLLVSLESLGRHTVQMLHDVLDAFARMDLDEAVRIYREDKKVDQEYEGIVRQLMTYMMEDSRTIPSVLTALFCARSIERIGDRCQNICEYIFYFVKGQDFRHVGGDELDKLLAGKDPKE